MNAKMIDHEQAIKTMMAERYLLGELTESERDAYEAHLFDCQTCFDQVKAGTEFVSYLKQIGAEEPVTTTVVQPPRRQFLDYFSRPIFAPVFAMLFLCFVGLSLYQGRVIHKFKESRAMAATTIKEARRGDGGNVVRAPQNGIFTLRLLFDPQPDYTSYEGQIYKDDGTASSANPSLPKGNTILKSFNITGQDAQDAVDVYLYSGDLHEGDYALDIFGVKPGSPKTKIATYYFKLQK